MPIYEYQCTECDYTISKIHKMTETPEFVCQTCRKALKKILSSDIGIKGSGGGWHGNRKGRKIQ